MATTDHSELLAQLTSGIAALTSSKSWSRHLDYQGRFHGYSFSNVVLIASQRSDATKVAGFRTWKRLDRSVRKGEKAIWVLAPMMAKRADDGAIGEEKVIRGFKYVPVFDISQTEGEDMPNICHRLVGDDPKAFFSRLIPVAQSVGYGVELTRLPEGVNGDCTFSLRRIRVEERNSPAQRVKSLIHEIAHARLHEGQLDRPLAELEAESTAYVVCRGLGMDTDAYSFGYVAIWAGGGEAAIAGIRSSCAAIQRTASFVLASLETAPDGGVSAAA
jgi:antirestriction protein ArdC